MHDGSNDDCHLPHGKALPDAATGPVEKGQPRHGVARCLGLWEEAIGVEVEGLDPVGGVVMDGADRNDDGGLRGDCVPGQRVPRLRRARREEDGRIHAQRLLDDALQAGEVAHGVDALLWRPRRVAPDGAGVELCGDACLPVAVLAETPQRVADGECGRTLAGGEECEQVIDLLLDSELLCTGLCAEEVVNHGGRQGGFGVRTVAAGAGAFVCITTACG